MNAATVKSLESSASLEGMPSQMPPSSSLLSSSASVKWFEKSEEKPLVVRRVELNVLWWVVMALAFALRFWRLDYPCYVV